MLSARARLLTILLTVPVGFLAACGADGGDAGAGATATRVSASPAPEAPASSDASLDATLKASNKLDPVVRPGADAPLDSITDELASPDPAAPDLSQRLFASGFEAGVTLSEPEGFRNGDRHLHGGDVAGADFQADRWRTPDHRRHWINSVVGQVTGAPVTEFLTASLKTVTGRSGSPTRALSLHSHSPSGGSGFQQIAVQHADLGVEPVLYQRMWIKFDPTTLAQAQAAGHWHYSQTFWEAATASDYRIRVKLRYDDAAGLYWQIKGESDGGEHGSPDWSSDLKTVPVVLAAADQPAGWHKVEIWLDRPGGRIRAAIDGQSLVDRTGPLTGAGGQPLQTLRSMMVYSSAAPIAETLFDDLSYWLTPPADAFR